MWSLLCTIVKPLLNNIVGLYIYIQSVSLYIHLACIVRYFRACKFIAGCIDNYSGLCLHSRDYHLIAYLSI